MSHQSCDLPLALTDSVYPPCVSLSHTRTCSLPIAGDLPVFAQLLGDGDARKPFTGPAALIGLDVLAQRRIVLEAIPPALARTVGRKRRLFVARK